MSIYPYDNPMTCLKMWLLDLLATKAPPLKHPIPTYVLTRKGAQTRRTDKQAALNPWLAGGS